MSTVAAPLPPRFSRPAMVPDEVIWRLSVEQYHAMIRAGILTDDDPVELLDGWLVQKMGKNPPHTYVTRETRLALERLLPAGWFVNMQEPITLDASEPEPDLAVVRGEGRNYLDRHPGPSEAPLVIEVADASLYRDRGIKKRLYARAAVAVYWIINLVDGRVEVFTSPTGQASEEPTYKESRTFGPADEVPVVLDGREVGRIPVKQLLP